MTSLHGRPARALRLAALLLAVLPATSSFAGGMGPLVTDRPVPWGSGTVAPGDAEAKVRKTAGRYPDSVQSLSPDDNHVIGQRWMFVGRDGDSRILWVEFMRGRVMRVWTEPIEESLQPGTAPRR
ncbi:hypothetical protein [Solimonas variicoloris]|uniref:hypothetical protein n=1 Tax=Solimonas variicoloris TaxID=254408 RepID=UPI000399A3F2|nr:hypothetical protein [Solimonas variicoloris]